VFAYAAAFAPLYPVEGAGVAVGTGVLTGVGVGGRYFDAVAAVVERKTTQRMTVLMMAPRTVRRIFASSLK
jgi:hypothetical protein